MPVVALGGDWANGFRVLEMVKLEMVKMVAENITGGVVASCGHFIPEERPDEVVRHVRAMMTKRAVR